MTEDEKVCQWMQMAIEPYMRQIKSMLRDNYRLTLVARNIENPEAAVCITAEPNIEDVVASLLRLRQREMARSQGAAP